MPKVFTQGHYPAVFEEWRKTDFGRVYELALEGMSEDQIFDLHEVNPKLRPRCKANKDFRRVYDKGRAERSRMLYKKINESIENNNATIIKEAARNIIGWKETMDVPQNVHVIIDAPKWMKAKTSRGIKGKREHTN